MSYILWTVDGKFVHNLSILGREFEEGSHHFRQGAARVLPAVEIQRKNLVIGDPDIKMFFAMEIFCIVHLMWLEYIYIY